MKFEEYWNQYGELHASMCGGDIKQFANDIWVSAQGNIQSVDPTPAELCQQLANLTGCTTEAVIDHNGRCIVTLGGYIEPTYYDGINMIQNNWTCTEGHCFIIHRPVNYTGRWQDSKVTAMPQMKK